MEKKYRFGIEYRDKDKFDAEKIKALFPDSEETEFDFEYKLGEREVIAEIEITDVDIRYNETYTKCVLDEWEHIQDTADKEEIERYRKETLRRDRWLSISRSEYDALPNEDKINACIIECDFELITPIKEPVYNHFTYNLTEKPLPKIKDKLIVQLTWDCRDEVFEVARESDIEYDLASETKSDSWKGIIINASMEDFLSRMEDFLSRDWLTIKPVKESGLKKHIDYVIGGGTYRRYMIEDYYCATEFD